MILTLSYRFPQLRPGSGPDPTDPDPGGQKTTDPAPYILSLMIFYTTFRQIEVFAISFREKLSRKIDEISRKLTPFVKVFVFAKGKKSVFVPTLDLTA
jgi:hypothetical protein